MLAVAVAGFGYRCQSFLWLYTGAKVILLLVLNETALTTFGTGQPECVRIFCKGTG